MTLRHALRALAVALLAAAAPPAAAQPTAAQRAAVVDSLAALLTRLYADADTGRMIAEHVRSRARAGALDGARDWQHVARALTQELQRVNGDTHLFVDVAGPAPAAGGPPPAAHGVEEARRLAGNVGYLRMSHFLGGDAATAAMEGALRYLATTDAVILDLRNSRGGSAGLANFVISHFTGPDTLHSLTVYDRARDATAERYTLARVPGPRRPDVPLYVLTDDVTRSAAEDVPFVLQNLRRATIVGSRTAGAGRNNAVLALGHGLVASVSVTRVMEPRTRREWERVGVRPDVVTPPESALVVAHRLAVTRLAERAPEARRRELTLVAEALAAEAAPPRVASSRLAPYVGTYEGGQFVTVAGGRLVYQSRVAQPRVALVALDARTFADGATRYAFDADAGGAWLTITTPDGASTRYRRTAPTVPAPLR